MTLIRIYKISNSVNVECYFGSTKVNLNVRLKQHLSKARKNPSSKFHKLIVELGEDKFTIELLEEQEIKTKEEYEQEYISKFKDISLNSVDAFILDEDLKLKRQKYIEQVKEHHKELKKKWDENNKEHVQEYKKEYRTNNKDKIKSYKKLHDKDYYEKNKEKILKKRKEYAEANKDRIKEYKHKYHLSKSYLKE